MTSRPQRLAVAVLVALIASGVPFLLDDLRPELPFPDFSGYYLAGAALNRGQPPYDVEVQRRISEQAGTEADVPWSRFIYPPPVAAAMRPLALLPYLSAALVWLACSLAALIFSVYRLLKLYRWPGGARGHVVALCCVTTPAALETLFLGQSNTFLLLLVVMALRTAGPHATGRAAGVWIAIATTLKLFPAAFLLALPQRWLRPALTGFTAIALVALGLGLAFGGGLNALRDWPDTIPPVMQELESAPSNQSIHGVMRRLAQGGTFPARTIPDPGVATVHLEAVVSPHTARIIAWAAVVLIVAPASLVAVRREPGLRARRIDVGLRLSVLTGAALIATPLVWDHYYVLLLLNALVVLRVSRRDSPAWWVFIAGAYLLVLHRYWRVLIVLGGHAALSLGLLGTVLCWAASVMALHGRAAGVPDRNPTRSQGPPQALGPAPRQAARDARSARSARAEPRPGRVRI